MLIEMYSVGEIQRCVAKLAASTDISRGLSWMFPAEDGLEEG